MDRLLRECFTSKSPRGTGRIDTFYLDRFF
jgi:hypothetical protein